MTFDTKPKKKRHVYSGGYTYRGYKIEWAPKPIPESMGVDWDFYHEEYGGPGDKRCGSVASLPAAFAEINRIEDEDE